MNGAGNGNIIFGDGLDNHTSKGIDNNSFDILVANPPYSVRAFKSHLKLEENEFELTDFISNESGEIEVLFVERITQLLKPNAIAAVILPSSILSNTSNSYMGARDVILKNFKIKAISQFSNKTFGATGTNTVVLFLQKYNEPPKHYKIVDDSIQAIFNNEKSSEWMDNEVIGDFLSHIRVDKDIYSMFIKEALDYEKLLKDEYFKMYVDEFNNSTTLRNMISRNVFKKLTKEEQKSRINSMFYDYAKNIEREKLFYFALVREQETLVIKVPSTATEQYEFLGYQWSNRKGSEGIQIKNMGGKLYDPNNRESKNHIAPLIRCFLNENLIEIEEQLEKYADILQTKNMFDFEREKFDRAIQLNRITRFVPISAYPIKNLEDVYNKSLTIQKGTAITKEAAEKGKFKVVAGGIDYAYFHNEYNRNENVITISASGANAGYVNYWSEKIFASDCTTIRANDTDVTKYIYYYLKLFQDEIFKLAKGSAQPHVYSRDLKKFNVPEVSSTVLKKVISECGKLEEKYETTRMKIEEYKLEIQKIFEDFEVIKNDRGTN